MFIYGAVTFSEDPKSLEISNSIVKDMRRYFDQRGMMQTEIAEWPGAKLAFALPPRIFQNFFQDDYLILNDSELLMIGGSVFEAAPTTKGQKKAGSYYLNRLIYRVKNGGIEELYKINGEFCALFFSKEEKRLTLMRDHFGTKPLYYWVERQNKLIAFASCVSALIAIKGISRQLNERALGAFLVTYFPPAGETVFEDIKSVPPASSVTFDHDASSRVIRHWSPKPAHDWWENNNKRVVESFREELVRSVVSRIPEDGVTAFSLSGGIDSGAVAAIASKHMPHKRFLSFTDVLPAGYDGPARDERNDVEKLVQFLPNVQANFVDALDRDPLAMGASALSLSGLPTMTCQSFFFDSMNAAAAASGVSVLLGGWGGDQCVSAAADGHITELVLGGHFIQAWGRISHFMETREMSLASVLRSQLAKAVLPQGLIERGSQMLGSDWLAATALRRDFAEEFALKAYLETTGWTFPARVHPSINAWAIGSLEFIIRTHGWLIGEEGFSDWHGIEYRNPLYDWRLIEACLAIPSHYKVSANKERLLLRSAARPFLPSFIIDRDDKGIGTPFLLTRLHRDIDTLKKGFDRFSSIGTWRRIVDIDKVAKGMANLESTSDWAVSKIIVSQVLYPYYLGDYLERIGHQAM
jgi:asparagine synthase (glutamine-hydrolysing)